jgi:hypothetical protein
MVRQFMLSEAKHHWSKSADAKRLAVLPPQRGCSADPSLALGIN